MPGHGSDQSATGPVLPGRGATDYERYMRVEELLALQKRPGEVAHRDELLFQTLHQTFELWLSQVCFELQGSAERMDRDQPLQAAWLVQRATRIVRLLTEQVHIVETITPWDFHEVRRQLGHGSGAESPGFRRVLLEAPPVYKHFQELLRRRGADLVGIYTRQDERPDLFLLAEAMTDFDMFFGIWRTDHLGMVKRVIGREVKSLKGYAVHQLEKDVQHELFPELWQVRNRLTELAGTSPA